MGKRRLPGKTAKCSVLSGLALAALLSPVAQAAMGLRLTDDSRRNVVPGLAGQPQLLTPGNNVLTYYIAPERTGAPLQAGAYLAHINFRLSYE